MYGGRCGICGDPWGDYPRAHEAPGGIYATGIIVKTYKQVKGKLCYLSSPTVKSSKWLCRRSQSQLPTLPRFKLEKKFWMLYWAVLKFFHNQGSYIPIIIDITANHQGYMEFKMCANNDIFMDPDQRCFDSSPALKVGNPEEEPSLKGLVANSIRLRCPFLQLNKNVFLQAHN